MLMEERDTISFYEAIAITREHGLNHYFLGDDKHILVVQDGEEIRMFKDIGIRK